MIDLTPLQWFGTFLVAAGGLYFAYKKHQRDVRQDGEAKELAREELRLQVEARRLTPMLVRISVAYDARDRSRGFTAMLDIDRRGFGVIREPRTTPEAVDFNRLDAIFERSFLELKAAPEGPRFSAECTALWTFEAGDLPLTISIYDSAHIDVPIFSVMRSVTPQA
jgi:hypothetical protein